MRRSFPKKRFGGFALLALAATWLLIAGCATSKGSTFAESRRSEAGAANRARAAGANSGAPSKGRASPDRGGGSVAIDLGVIAGTASRAAYGTLVVTGLEGGAELFVDGVYYLGNSARVTAGPHNIRVSRFGYAPYEFSVDIEENEQREVRVDLRPVPFSLSSVKASPEAFDPSDPGFLGGCAIRSAATAAGSAAVSVGDAAGNLVRDLGEIRFAAARGSVRWDGRDGTGRPVGNGRYRIRIEGRGDDGTLSSTETSVSVVGGSFARTTTLYSGVSGTLFAPDARVAAPERIETASGFLGHIDADEGYLKGRATVHSGIRLGLGGAGSGSRWEIDASGLFILHPGDPAAADLDALAFTAAAKFAFLTGPDSAAVYLKGTVSAFLNEDLGGWPSDWDGPTRFGGVSIGLPLEKAFDRIRLMVAPEIQVSTFYPGYGSDLSWNVPGFFVWAYLRAGFEYTLGSVTFAVSAAPRTSPFDGGSLKLDLPVPAGLEVRWHAAQAPLVLSFLAVGEFGGKRDYYLSSGLSVGFRF